MAQPRNDFTLGDSAPDHLDWTNQVGTRMQAVFDVKADYGAEGDGTTDDAAAIEAAIAAADAADLAEPVVFFPPGVYYLAHTSTRFDIFGERLTLKGAGQNTTVIKANTARATGLAVNGSDVTIEDLQFLTDHATRTLLVEYGSGKDRCRIRRCYFTSTSGTPTGGNAIEVSGSSALTKEDTVIEDCRFHTVYRGIRATGGQEGLVIRNNLFTDLHENGIRLNSSDATYIEDALIEGNRFYDYPTDGGASSLNSAIKTDSSSSDHRNIRVLNNFVKGTDNEYGSDPPGTADQFSFNNVDGLIFANNISIDGGDMGVTLESDVLNFTVIGNYCYNNDIAGIWNTGSRGTIVGNACINNGQDRATSGSANRAGIVLGSSADTVTISGNTCTDDQGTETQEWGITITSGATDIKIGDNNLNGNGTGMFNMQGTAYSTPSYTDVSRPAATAVPDGYMIWNTDDGFPNWSDGTNWVEADGTTT
jgi:hypothetical protein